MVFSNKFHDKDDFVIVNDDDFEFVIVDHENKDKDEDEDNNDFVIVKNDDEFVIVDLPKYKISFSIDFITSNEKIYDFTQNKYIMYIIFYIIYLVNFITKNKDYNLKLYGNKI
jgi:hypothetical protein